MWKAFTCPGCSCLCDDVFIEIAGKNVESFVNICSKGEKKLSSVLKGKRISSPKIGRGKWEEVDYRSAIKESVRILTESKKPLIYGFEQTGSRAQAMGMEIAKKLKGIFLGSKGLSENEYLLTLQKRSFYLANLDEIRDNADLVLFLEYNPHELQPRHLAHFSVYPRGKYRERGFQERTVITIATQDSEMRKISQLFVLIDPGKMQAGLKRLLQLLRGERSPLEGDEIALSRVAHLMNRCSYGVLFFPASLLSGIEGPYLRNLLVNLSDELNNGKRFILFPTKAGFNSVGLDQLLLRETGTPFGFDFLRNHPLIPGELKAEAFFLQADAALIVASDPYPDFSQHQSWHFNEIDSILLEPFETKTSYECNVVFPVAVAGMETDEIAYRMDGIPFRLKKVIDNSLLPDFSILQDIYSHL